MTRLADIAPRLAKARDQLEASFAQSERDREQVAAHVRHLETEVAALVRLVAHRDLMLLRACSSGRAGWIAERSRKLSWAQKRLAKREAELAAATRPKRRGRRKR